MICLLFQQKNGGGGGGESANLSDEESWKVIKTWAEAMLPACFGSINDLAAFIAKNNLNSSTGNTGSRQQLQKKILQREMKEKRKLSVRHSTQTNDRLTLRTVLATLYVGRNHTSDQRSDSRHYLFRSLTLSPSLML